MIWSAIIAFLAMFLLDIIWARYIKAVSADHIARACGLAALITLLSGTVVVQYTTDWRMLGPAILGAMAGTWVALRK